MTALLSRFLPNRLNYVVYLRGEGLCKAPQKFRKKQSLFREWEEISVEELRKMPKNFQKRLMLCVEAKGG